VVFVMTHPSGRDFSVITMLFCIAPLSSVQLENNGVMLMKFCFDSWVVTNSDLVGHSWVGLGPILSYRYI
jgi:hypothetical protein